MAKTAKVLREMTTGEKNVLELWTELRVLVEQIDSEVNKFAVRGNQSAGVRVRKGTRDLRTLAIRVSKATLAAREETKLARLEHKKALAEAKAAETTSTTPQESE